MNKRKKYLTMMIAAGLIFGLFFGVGSGLTSLIVNRAEADDNKTPENEEEILERQDGERTNILLLGVDARPGEETARSDTMILVSVDPDLNKAAVVSIPRDTKVTIKGATEKICAANVLGGPDLAASLVGDLMNIKVDYWVEMDFNGFEKIVDTLGGVTVTVPERMYKPSEGIDLQPGTKKLDGHDALGFVRYRDYAMGDIDRTSQQQVFMKALAKEVLQAKTIPKLPKLIKDLNKYVKTNMKTTDMLRIASWAPGFKAEEVVAQTLPGAFYDQVDENGILLQSYWQVDKKQAAGLLETMFEGETIAVVQNAIQTVVPTQDSTDSDEEPDDEEETATKEGDSKKGPTGYAEVPQPPTTDPQDIIDPEEEDEVETEVETEAEPEAPTPPPADPTGPEGYL
jgi:LCP family protein required for cell wall assembly